MSKPEGNQPMRTVVAIVWAHLQVSDLVIGGHSLRTFLEQIRILAKLGHLVNFLIWLNIIITIAMMAVTAHTVPCYNPANTAIVINPSPVITTAAPPERVAVHGQISGLT